MYEINVLKATLYSSFRPLACYAKRVYFYLATRLCALMSLSSKFSDDVSSKIATEKNHWVELI